MLTNPVPGSPAQANHKLCHPGRRRVMGQRRKYTKKNISPRPKNATECGIMRATALLTMTLQRGKGKANAQTGDCGSPPAAWVVGVSRIQFQTVTRIFGIIAQQ